MAGLGAGYDLSVSTFSPDGRIFQVEYASKAAFNGNLISSVICKDGILMIVEKILTSKLKIPESTTRIFFIDNHCFAAVTGFFGDGREVVNRAQTEAREYKNIYGEPIPGSILAERIAQYVHIYTLAWSERPFGCSILLGSVNKFGETTLHSIDPAGNCYSYKATIIGKNSQSVKTELEKLNFQSMSCTEVLNSMIFYIMKTHQDSIERMVEFEVASISRDARGKVQRYSTEYIKNIHKEALELIRTMDDVYVQN